VIGATSLPRVRRKFSADMIIAISTGVFIGTLLILAFVRYPLIIIPVLLVAGFAWTSTMSTLNLAIQVSAPQLGAGPGAGHLPDDLLRGHGAGQRHLGADRGAFLNARLAATAAGGMLVTLPFSLKMHVLRGSSSPI
jgi:hypothetical protein